MCFCRFLRKIKSNGRCRLTRIVLKIPLHKPRSAVHVSAHPNILVFYTIIEGGGGGGTIIARYFYHLTPFSTVKTIVYTPLCATDRVVYRYTFAACLAARAIRLCTRYTGFYFLFIIYFFTVVRYGTRTYGYTLLYVYYYY